MSPVEFMNRLRALFSRDREARELAEEMRHHREMIERDALASGQSVDEARYTASRRFGNTTWYNEESREMWRIQPIETLTQDLRYAVRFLRASPVFTVVAVLSLALGIGANTAVFTLINQVVVRDLPVHEPERIALLEPAVGEDPRMLFPNPYFRGLDSATTSFEGLFAAWRQPAMAIDRGNGPEQTSNGVTFVSGRYFELLGVRPAIGRLIGPGDDIEPGGHPVLVISHDYWRNAFGGDSSVIGRPVRVNGFPFTIVGVAQRGFFGTQIGERTDLYLPLMMAHVPGRGDATLLQDTGNWWLFVMGRLKPGVTHAQASADASLQFQRVMVANPPGRVEGAEDLARLRAARVLVMDGSGGLPILKRRWARPLTVLGGMSAVVLLIACINLASLMSARAAARRKEIAIRLSMGAGRRRLLTQLLTESALLSVVGSAAGLVVATFGARALLGVAARGRAPLWVTVTPDLGTLAFTAAAAILTTLIFGIVPALQATRLDLAPTLRAGGSAGRSPSSIRLGKVLIATQVAFSVLLVFAGSLFVRNVQRLNATATGFDRENVLVVRVDPRRNGYRGESARAFYDELLARTRALPGVEAAALASHTPFSGSESSFDGRVDGHRDPKGEPAYIIRVTTEPGYFRAMGIALRSGRYLEPSDVGGGGGPRFAVVNEAFVREFVPSGQPLGKRFYTSRQDSVGVTIVGVVGDVKFNSFRDEARPIAYWQYAADTVLRGPAQSLFIRTTGDPASLVPAVKRTLGSIDQKVEILRAGSLEEQMDGTISNERIVASLSGFFGLFALILAMVGLYGLMAYVVSSRTRELGIRMALGAASSSVARGVMREAIVLVTIGMALGIPAALAASRVGAALLYELEPTDAPTMIITAGLLFAVATIAAAFPALRAARIDPVRMLRIE